MQMQIFAIRFYLSRSEMECFVLHSQNKQCSPCAIWIKTVYVVFIAPNTILTVIISIILISGKHITQITFSLIG